VDGVFNFVRNMLTCWPSPVNSALAFPVTTSTELAKACANNFLRQAQSTSSLHCIRAKKKHFLRLQPSLFNRFMLRDDAAILSK